MKSLLTVAMGCLTPIAVIITGLALFFGVLGFRYYTADIRGRVDAQETIKSGANRIAQYDRFFNLCASIQAQEGMLTYLEEELGAAAPEDKARISANITGVQAARARAIAQYNADATKNYTSGQFRDSDLPYQLSVEGVTQCAAY